MFRISVCLLVSCIYVGSASAQNLQLNIVRETVELSSSDFIRAEAKQERDQWVVYLHFSPEGSKKIAGLTADNINRTMQVVIGDRILITALIQTAIREGVIVIKPGIDQGGEVWARDVVARFKR